VLLDSSKLSVSALLADATFVFLGKYWIWCRDSNWAYFCLLLLSAGVIVLVHRPSWSSSHTSIWSGALCYWLLSSSILPLHTGGLHP